MCTQKNLPVTWLDGGWALLHWTLQDDLSRTVISSITTPGLHVQRDTGHYGGLYRGLTPSYAAAGILCLYCPLNQRLSCDLPPPRKVLISPTGRRSINPSILGGSEKTGRAPGTCSIKQQWYIMLPVEPCSPPHTTDMIVGFFF